MSEETEEVIEAIKGSIKKWEKIADGKGVDQGRLDCPLCQLFADAPNYCEGCPVFQYSKRRNCTSTPYYLWVAHTDNIHPNKLPRKVQCHECERIALNEAAFLRLVLKEVTDNESGNESA